MEPLHAYVKMAINFQEASVFKYAPRIPRVVSALLIYAFAIPLHTSKMMDQTPPANVQQIMFPQPHHAYYKPALKETLDALALDLAVVKSVLAL